MKFYVKNARLVYANRFSKPRRTNRLPTTRTRNRSTRARSSSSRRRSPSPATRTRTARPGSPRATSTATSRQRARSRSARSRRRSSARSGRRSSAAEGAEPPDPARRRGEGAQAGLRRQPLLQRELRSAPDAAAKNRVAITAADGVLYAGCYVDGAFDVWAFPQRSSVNIALLAVTFSHDGERLAGGATASEDDYAAVPAEAQAKARRRRAKAQLRCSTPTTDVWCFAWAIGDEEPQRLDAGGPTSRAAHAAHRTTAERAFELEIWNEILVKRYGFPPLARSRRSARWPSPTRWACPARSRTRPTRPACAS
jgi:hypothetical protein